jgi:hypothetical protein
MNHLSMINLEESQYSNDFKLSITNHSYLKQNTFRIIDFFS